MKPLRVLWLCNAMVQQHDAGNSGTWLGALAQRLLASGTVELGIICEGGGQTTCRADCGPITQWVVPYSRTLRRDGLPSRAVLESILHAVEEFAPDLIHVWGTESYWGLLTGRQYITAPAVLFIQGLKYAIAEVYTGGLTLREALACTGVKELIGRSTQFHHQRAFARWGRFEREIIGTHQHIICCSQWDRSQVWSINPSIMPYHWDMVLRDPFYTAFPWTRPAGHRVFCSAAYPAPFKGLHIAVRATALLAQVYPDVELRIAGHRPRAGLRRDGYLFWMQREIARLGIAQNTVWVGPLAAPALVDELHAAAAMIVPTYIDNGCLAFQEAMLVGTPVVSSYAGGTPSNGQDGESCLFFPMGDAAACASQVHALFREPGLSERLSTQARAFALVKNDPERAVKRQLNIYRQVAGIDQPSKICL